MATKTVKGIVDLQSEVAMFLGAYWALNQEQPVKVEEEDTQKADFHHDHDYRECADNLANK